MALEFTLSRRSGILSTMRPPAGAQIYAPEFPPKMEWLNVAYLRMAGMLDRRCVLIEFFDTARINSHRTLPYLQGWDARYAARGLRVVGVHTPGYSFGRETDLVSQAAERMGVAHPVLLDPDYRVWKLYGNRGWPGRYLFDKLGILRYIHYGEGGYSETEAAIVEVLGELDGADLQPREPLTPLRPEDADGAVLEPQTADIALPAERERLALTGDWSEGEDYLEARAAGATATATWQGGGAWAVLSGEVDRPGLHETEGTVVAERPGMRLHAFQFTVSPPART